jgi:hypothetical protein
VVRRQLPTLVLQGQQMMALLKDLTARASPPISATSAPPPAAPPPPPPLLIHY